MQLSGFPRSEHTCVTTAPLTKSGIIDMGRPSSCLLRVTSPHSPEGRLCPHFFRGSTVLAVLKLLKNCIAAYALLPAWPLLLSLSRESPSSLWEAIVGSFSSLIIICCMAVSYVFTMSLGLSQFLTTLSGASMLSRTSLLVSKTRTSL